MIISIEEVIEQDFAYQQTPKHFFVNVSHHYLSHYTSLAKQHDIKRVLYLKVTSRGGTQNTPFYCPYKIKTTKPIPLKKP